MDAPLVRVHDLVKEFHLPGGWYTRKRPTLRAVDRVSFDMMAGEVLGLVGESGCGKTTLGRMMLRLIDITSGEVVFNGVDLTHLDGSALRKVRPQMQIVFQNPLSSLSPRLKVLDIVAEPLRTHLHLSPQEERSQVVALLQQVGLGDQYLDRFPHEMSGGQCQRVAVARSLALKPRLIVLDEPTSALDVSVQAQIINLLEELHRAYGLTFLFISHDLSVVQHISDRIGVMYLGQMVEIGRSEAIFEEPLHPYTQALLASIPFPEVGRHHKLIVLQGNVPSPENPPPGCRFHTRCPLVQPICIEIQPDLRAVQVGRMAACHMVKEQF